MADISGRTVVIGKNSLVWRRLCQQTGMVGRPVLALGHADIAAAEFTPADVVWILSYSRDAEQNRQMLRVLADKRAGRYVYISTATANVAEFTSCYGYPAAKAAAERDARRLLGAQIVRVGLVYGDLAELPSGTSAATRLDEIVAAISAAPTDEVQPNLFAMIKRPFGSPLEAALFAIYGRLIGMAGRRPCVLRPLDLLLKGLGMRWYGYLYLSNRLLLRDEATV